MRRATTKTHRGVYALLLSRPGHIVLVKKARGPYTGMLDLPGGAPEKGETGAQTAVREVEEETGLRAVSLRYLGDVSFVYEYQDESLWPHVPGPVSFHHTGSIYSARAVGEGHQHGDELDSWGWVEVPLARAGDYRLSPLVQQALEAASR